MNNSRKSANSFLIGLVWFAIGLVIGLVVLGWWLWPVHWIGGSFNTLQPVDQQEYLRTVIEAFSYNADAGLASERFESIGENKDALLRQLYQSPEAISPQQIEQFASAIGAESSLTYAPQQPSSAPVISDFLSQLNNQFGLSIEGIGAILGLLFLFILLILVLINRRKKHPKPAEGPAVRTYDTPLEPAAGPVISEPDFETFNVEEQEKTEIPDWLDEARQDFSSTTNFEKGEESELIISEDDFQDLAAVEAEDYEIDTDLLPASAVPEQIRDPQGESSDQTYQKFTGSIQTIPGVEPLDVQKLSTAGITVPLILLKQGAKPDGRRNISERTGIEETSIASWIKRIDLLRIPDLTLEDLTVLQFCGVHSVEELKQQEPDSLTDAVLSAVKEMPPSYVPPSKALVAQWIEQANGLPQAVDE